MASMRLVWQSSLRAARLSAFQQGGSAARRHVSPFHSTAFNAKLAKEQLQKFERNDPVDYQELKPIADMPSDDVLLIGPSICPFVSQTCLVLTQTGTSRRSRT